MSDLREPRFIILSEPRSGSNNVLFSLKLHPALDVANERLHPFNGIKSSDFDLTLENSNPPKSWHWSAGESREIQETVFTRLFTDHNGFKSHVTHYPADRLIDFARAFNAKFLVTWREDAVAQTLSNFIAIRRNKWHADNKHWNEEDIAGPLEPAKAAAWIKNLLQARQACWRAVLEAKIPVRFASYEQSYDGDQDKAVARVLRTLDFIGAPRYGQLTQAEQAKIWPRLLHFLDPSKQKMTTGALVDDVITNSAEAAAAVRSVTEEFGVNFNAIAAKYPI